MSKYVDKGYFLLFDNFCTTLDLVQNLLTGNNFSCGTIRVNRRMFPVAFKNEKFAVGSSSFLKTNENLLVVHWKDKRDAFALSSFHSYDQIKITWHAGQIRKPEIICGYSNHMGGADECDQYLSYYTIVRKEIKWCKKVFFRLLEMNFVNAIYLYFHMNPEIACNRDSHKILCLALIYMLVIRTWITRQIVLLKKEEGRNVWIRLKEDL